jgi:hypothetical protein
MAVRPNKCGSEFSYEFSYEFLESIPGITCKSKKVVINVYYPNNLLAFLQSQLESVSRTRPVAPPISGLLTTIISESANNRISILQGQLNRIYNAASTPIPQPSRLVTTMTEKTNNKLARLQSQLERIRG